jgi:hypothetical protein
VSHGSRLVMSALTAQALAEPPALRTDEPLAPIEDRSSGAVPSSHLCRVGLDLMLAAFPSVIRGPGSDFI